MRTLISLLTLLLASTSFASDTSFDHTAAAQLMAETDYAGTVIKSEQALAENPNKLGLFEPLTKSYAYLGMFDAAAQRTHELYFESDAEHPLLTLSGHCRYALFHTMQGEREKALAAVDEMLTHETPDNIYPGAPACSTFFDTAWNNNERAEHNLQRVIEAAPQLDALVFMPFLVHVKRDLGKAEEAQQLLVQLVQTRMAIESGAMDEQIDANTDGVRTPATEQIIQNWRAQVLILEGKPEQAVTAMRKAYEAGALFRYHWWKAVNPIFTDVRTDPEVQTLFANMEADIAKQRERVKLWLAAN